jgi:hypothetical protein
MYSLGLETIAGSKLLQLKFGAAGRFQPDQSVLHGDRRARFIRVDNGAALVRHAGDSNPVVARLDALSLPAPQAERSRVRPHLKADARPDSAPLEQSKLVRRGRMGWLPGHHRRPILHP